MDTPGNRNLEQHVPIVGWLLIVLHVFSLLIACVIFFGLLLGGAFAREAEAILVLTIVAIVAGGLILIFSIPGIFAGAGLIQRKPWARPLSIIIGFLSLLNFPLGTLLGIYILYVLLPQESAAYFDSEPANQTGVNL